MILIGTPEEIRALVAPSPETKPILLRAQESGPCVYYDPHLIEPCTYPYDRACPHLDNPAILCPVKDACYAMHEVARLRDVCEAEQEEQDADMAAVAPSQTYETAAPEWVEPAQDDGALHTYTVPATRKPHPSAWSDEEEEVIRRAQSAAEAWHLYSETYGIWKRSQSAVTSRWYRLRDAGELAAPGPDEDPVFVVPHPTYRPGDRVRIKHALHRGQTGEIRRYFPATENYLVAIDGMPDMIVLTDAQMEAV